MAMAKSCYVLELSVTLSGTAGGVRRGDLFTYNRLVHIRRCLEHEFLHAVPDDRAYAASLAVGRGETIVLWVVEGGRLVRGIDLRRHVRLRVGDEAAGTLEQARQRDDAWKEALGVDGSSLVFEIDWDAIAAETPALQGEPLRYGETLDLYVDEDVVAPFDSYLEISDQISYGYEDLEGFASAPPGFVDPDPGRASIAGP